MGKNKEGAQMTENIRGRKVVELSEIQKKEEEEKGEKGKGNKKGGEEMKKEKNRSRGIKAGIQF